MSLRDEFTEFAEWCDGTSPLYARLARGVADDPDLLAVADAVPEGRPAPHTLFAAVHSLLLDGADHELREWYPSVVGDAAHDPAEADLMPAFVEFVLAHETRVRELVATRRTQTNAVGRCSALYPAFARVAARVDGPLALVEVGTSAGLNLCFDRYRYRYETDAGVRTVGVDDSPVRIDCALRGTDPPLPADPPTVASRVGIDLNPLDVTDDADLNWLRALVWPEHVDRHDQLAAAAEVVRPDPPRLVAGDAIDRLPAVVAELPNDRPVCVYDTQVLYQLGEAQRDRYRAVLVELAADRELHWVSGSHVVGQPDEGTIPLRHTAVSRDGLDGTTVAHYEPHGRWLEWIAPEE
ncbi:DUF2332 domain-containing protein [Haloarchaeobius baliensis]|uniref:DUF2332 domain-containing protein n=1 Tax=Haloarchaeobius baliensis TaxID=1670458 RepID=UPI003F885D33